MSPRPFWKGYLQLSLVTCPVAMTPAVSETEKVRFQTVNGKTGHRVISRFVDSVTGRTVEDEDQAKGYARGDDEHVLFEDDEPESVGLESARTIDIETFAPAASIDWIWYERAHFLTPDGAVGEEPFCVIRDAMNATGRIGISRLVLYGRERAVMLKPRDKGIILWTLRYGDEVRDAPEVAGKEASRRVERKAMELLSRAIDRQTQPWSAEMTRDPVQLRLLEMIAEKQKFRKSPARKTPPPSSRKTSGNVISIMDALQKSVSAEKKPRRR